MPLAATFILACLATLMTPVLFPSLRLLYFAPFLIAFIYNNKLSHTLWMALACGLFLDLLASGTRIGQLALNFILTALILFQLKRYFFRDRLSTMPLMTFLFSATSAFLQAILNAIFLRGTFLFGLFFSWDWLCWDILVMPACDALFAFSCVICTGLFIQRRSYSISELT